MAVDSVLWGVVNGAGRFLDLPGTSDPVNLCTADEFVCFYEDKHSLIVVWFFL